jgi:hypothetical protein
LQALSFKQATEFRPGFSHSLADTFAGSVFD